MATFFWVGGAGTWDNSSTTHWAASSGGTSGAGPPTSTDSVVFDANSGLTSAGGTVTIAATAVCGGCTISGIVNALVFFSLTGSVTWSAGTYSFQGSDAAHPILIQSSAPGVQRTMTINGTHGTHSAVHFEDIQVAGTAGTLTGTLIGDCGGNGAGVSVTASAAQAWQGTSGGNWNDVTKWTSRIPLPQDDVTVSAAFSAAQTVHANMARLGRSIDFTGTTGNPTVSIDTSVTFYGSITFVASPSMTLFCNNSFKCDARGLVTWTNAGQAFGTGNAVVQASGPGGTVSQQDDLVTASTTAGAWRVANGATWRTNGHNVTCGSFQSTSGVGQTQTVDLGGGGTVTLNATGSLTIWNPASGNFVLLNAAGATFLVASPDNGVKTFTGLGKSYGTLRYTSSSGGGLTLTGSNSFQSLDLRCTSASTITLPAGGTQVVSGGTLTLRGQTGNLLSLASSSPGTGTAIVAATGAFYNLDSYSPSGDVTIVLPGAGATARALAGRQHL